MKCSKCGSLVERPNEGELGSYVTITQGVFRGCEAIIFEIDKQQTPFNYFLALTATGGIVELPREAFTLCSF